MCTKTLWNDRLSAVAVCPRCHVIRANWQLLPVGLKAIALSSNRSWWLGVGSWTTHRPPPSPLPGSLSKYWTNFARFIRRKRTRRSRCAYFRKPFCLCCGGRPRTVGRIISMFIRRVCVLLVSCVFEEVSLLLLYHHAKSKSALAEVRAMVTIWEVVVAAEK